MCSSLLGLPRCGVSLAGCWHRVFDDSVFAMESEQKRESRNWFARVWDTVEWNRGMEQKGKTGVEVTDGTRTGIEETEKERNRNPI